MIIRVSQLTVVVLASFFFSMQLASAQCSATQNCALCNGSGTVSCTATGGAGCTTDCANGCPGASCCTQCPKGTHCNEACCTVSGATASPNTFCNFTPVDAVAWVRPRQKLLPASYGRLEANRGATQSLPVQLPRVRTATPADIPVQISGVRPEMSSTGHLKTIHYTLANDGSAPLIAWRVIWAIYTGGRTDKPTLMVADRSDYWYGGASDVIASGASGQSWVCAAGSASAKVTLLRGYLDYAEFADGSRVGPAVAKVFPELEHRRAVRLAIYRQALEAYSSGGAPAVLKILSSSATTNASDTTLRSQQSAALALYQQDGLGSFLSEARRKVAAGTGRYSE